MLDGAFRNILDGIFRNMLEQVPSVSTDSSTSKRQLAAAYTGSILDSSTYRSWSWCHRRDQSAEVSKWQRICAGDSVSDKRHLAWSMCSTSWSASEWIWNMGHTKPMDARSSTASGCLSIWQHGALRAGLRKFFGSCHTNSVPFDNIM